MGWQGRCGLCWGPGQAGLERDRFVYREIESVLAFGIGAGGQGQNGPASDPARAGLDRRPKSLSR
jgi:hypothetical protein